MTRGPRSLKMPWRPCTPQGSAKCFSWHKYTILRGLRSTPPNLGNRLLNLAVSLMRHRANRASTLYCQSEAKSHAGFLENVAQSYFARADNRFRAAWRKNSRLACSATNESAERSVIASIISLYFTMSSLIMGFDKDSSRATNFAVSICDGDFIRLYASSRIFRSGSVTASFSSTWYGQAMQESCRPFSAFAQPLVIVRTRTGSPKRI